MLGVGFVFLTPLFQVPDEPNHAYRAYQISTGILVAEMRNGHVGGDVPSSLEQTFCALCTLTSNKSSRVRGSTLRTLQDQPLNPSVKSYISFSNTALHSPLVYLP